MDPDSAGLDDADEDRVTEKVSEIVVNREVIDQAKGMLMLAHGIDADKAFDLLRWRSQETNTKLQPLAQQVVSEFRALSEGTLPDREALDSTFMTAHERVPREDGDA